MARRLILASRSPRRLEALTALGLAYEAVPSGVEDVMGPLADPTDPVPIAEAKARDIATQQPAAVILAGDTVVVLASESLGKPVDPTDAVAMLQKLRAREHEVRSAAVTLADGQLRGASVACPLRMRDYSDDEIERYVASGEPLDCAGAYDVHKLGGALVEEVRGCFSSVVGLPLVQAAEMLRAAGIDVPRDAAQVCTELYGRPCLALRPETASACRASP